MRSKKLSLLILVALALLLRGNARSDDKSHPQKNLTQENSAPKQTSAPNEAHVGIPNQPKSAQPETNKRAYRETPIAVSPVTITKECFDYAVPLVTLLFAGALVFVSTMQWRTYDAQKQLLHQQTVFMHRPKLRIVDVRLVGQLEFNMPVEIALAVVNAGATTATIEQSNLTVRVHDIRSTPYRKIDIPRELPEPYDGDLHFFEQALGYSTLHGGKQTLPVSKQARTYLNPDEASEIRSKARTVYALGYIYYADEIRQYHKMAFCFRLNPFIERFELVRDPDLTFEF